LFGAFWWRLPAVAFFPALGSLGAVTSAWNEISKPNHRRDTFAVARRGALK